MTDSICSPDCNCCIEKRVAKYMDTDRLKHLLNDLELTDIVPVLTDWAMKHQIESFSHRHEAPREANIWIAIASALDEMNSLNPEGK